MGVFARNNIFISYKLVIIQVLSLNFEFAFPLQCHHESNELHISKQNVVQLGEGGGVVKDTLSAKRITPALGGSLIYANLYDHKTFKRLLVSEKLYFNFFFHKLYYNKSYSILKVSFSFEFNITRNI